MAFCTGCCHQKTEQEHILPVFSVHFILHWPTDLQNTTSKMRWLTTPGSRILGSPTKHPVLLSTGPYVITIQSQTFEDTLGGHGWKLTQLPDQELSCSPSSIKQIIPLTAENFSILLANWLEASSSLIFTLKTPLLCVDWCLSFEDRAHLLMSPRSTDALP